MRRVVIAYGISIGLSQVVLALMYMYATILIVSRQGGAGPSHYHTHPDSHTSLCVRCLSIAGPSAAVRDALEGRTGALRPQLYGACGTRVLCTP